ncbi:hypothetical protein D3C71_2093870 [compost metagenome]
MRNGFTDPVANVLDRKFVNMPLSATKPIIIQRRPNHPKTDNDSRRNRTAIIGMNNVLVPLMIG